MAERNNIPYVLILEASQSLDRHLIKKYNKSTYPPEEGRMDASTYVALALAIYGVYQVNPPLSADLPKDFIEDQAQKLAEAMEEAKKGNWQSMKKFLQEKARSSISFSAQIDPLGEYEPNFHLVAEKSEIDSKSFVNLANSLGV